MRRIRWSNRCTAFAVFILSACGGGTQEAPPPVPPVVQYTLPMIVQEIVSSQCPAGAACTISVSQPKNEVGK